MLECPARCLNRRHGQSCPDDTQVAESDRLSGMCYIDWLDCWSTARNSRPSGVIARKGRSYGISQKQ